MVEHIIDEIIIKIDVSEVDKYFGDYIRDNVLTWSKVFVSLDINTFKDENWDKKRSRLIIEEVQKFLFKSVEFFKIYPPKNLE